MFSKWILILHGLKYLKWSDNIFLIAKGSPNNDVIVKEFFLQNRTFRIIRKVIWFWSTFAKERNVNSDVTRRYIVSRLRGKNRKTRVIRLYPANYYCFSWIHSIKNAFFFAFWKRFFCWVIFNLMFLPKTSYVFVKQDFLKKFKVNCSLFSKFIVDGNWNTYLLI